MHSNIQFVDIFRENVIFYMSISYFVWKSYIFKCFLIYFHTFSWYVSIFISKVDDAIHVFLCLFYSLSLIDIYGSVACWIYSQRAKGVT